MRCALITCLVLIATSACNGAGSGGSAQPRPNLTIAASSTPTEAASARPAPTKAAPIVLAPALLTARDFGPPYTQQAPSPSTPSDDKSGCPALDKLSVNASTGTSSASASFTAGAQGPFVNETLDAEAPGMLATEFHTARRAITRCTTLKVPLGSGQFLDLTMTPIRVGGRDGGIGEELYGTLAGRQVSGTLDVEQVNAQVAMTFVFFQLDSGSSQEADALATQALQKAARVLGRSG